MAQQHTTHDTQQQHTDGHSDLDTKLAQWANSVREKKKNKINYKN